MIEKSWAGGRIALAAILTGTTFGTGGCRAEIRLTEVEEDKKPTETSVPHFPTATEETPEPTVVYTPTPEPTQTPEPTPIYLEAGGPEIGGQLSETFKQMADQEADFLKQVGEEQGLFLTENVQPKIFVKDLENETSGYAVALESTTSYGEYPAGTIFLPSNIAPPRVEGEGKTEGKLIPVEPKKDLTLDYSADKYDRYILKDSENKAVWFFADNDYMVENPEYIERFKEKEAEEMEGIVNLAMEGINWADEKVKPLEINLGERKITLAVDPRKESAVGRGIWYEQEGELEQFASLPENFNPEEQEITVGFEEDTLDLAIVNNEGMKAMEYDNEEQVWKEVETPTSTSEPTDTVEPTTLATQEPTEKPMEELTETPLPTERPEETVTGNEPVKNKMALLEIPLDAQDLSLSCESAAAAMVAAYFEIPVPEGYVSLEDYFIKTIPKDCNPHRGYRGLISGALSTSCNAEAGLGYGTYAEPVAAALQSLGVPVGVHYGVDYNWVAEHVNSGRPVVVWMSGKDVQPEYEVDPETGQEYVLYLGQHLWVISGVEEVNGRYKFRINDPWQGRQFWAWGFPNWDVFNNMSVVAGH